MPDATIAHRYRVLAPLGAGAMGRVLRVLDQATGQEVALKLLAGGDGRSALQLRQEFRLVAGLRHPHCCGVLDFGQTEDGEPFFTMEMVPGQGLDALRPCDEATFRRVMGPLLGALGYVHHQGLVHMDLKPANVRVTPEGTVKLMDFGLVEHVGRGSRQVRGTLPYVSPEVARRAPVDRRSDLYAVGVLAYELLTGELPFTGGSAATEGRRGTSIALLRAHVETAPRPPRELVPGLAPELESWVLRLLAKDPVERFASAAEAAAALGLAATPAGEGGLLASPHVGRGAELARLEGSVAAIAAGAAGGLVRLAGPAGVGKSRLLEELRFRVQLADVAFVGAVCAEHRGPGGAIAALVRGLLPLFKQVLPERLAEAAPVLGRLLPELAVAGAPEPESPKHERMRLHATLAELVAALARQRPLVLALDDAQRADDATHEAMAFLGRALTGMPALLILASRDDDHDEALALGGLAPEEVGQLARGLLGADALAPDFVAGLHALTGGTPLYVERVLEHLVRAGHPWSAEALTGADLTGTMTGLVARKLAELPGEALHVARLVAVLDAPAPLVLLAAASGLAEGALFEAIARLQRDQVLARDDDGDYGFVQRVYGQALREQLAPDEAAALHRAVLAPLAAGGAPPEALPAERVARLATHALAAGCRAEAIAYGLEAGRRAAALFALADAERWARAALALADDDASARFALLQLLGFVKRQAGQGAEAVAWLQQAVTLAPARHAALGRLQVHLGQAQLMAAAYDDALATLAAAAAGCLGADDPAGAARARLAAARARYFQGEVAVALAEAEAALALAAAGAERITLGRAHAFLGYMLVAAERIADGVAHLDRAAAILAEVDDRVGLNDAQNLLGNAANTLGEHGRARAAFEACVQLCRTNGLQEEEAVAEVNLAITALAQGEHAAARGHAGRAIALAEAVGARLPRGMGLALAGLAAAYGGEPAGAAARLAAALAEARGIGNRYLEALVLQRRLELEVELGRDEDALATAEVLAALVAATGHAEPAGPLEVWRALVLARQGALEAAASALGRARAIADRTGARGLQVLVGRLEATLALRQGAWEAAGPPARAALALAEAGGALGQAAVLHGLLGERALALGEPEAAAHFQAMRGLGDRLGTPVLQALAAFGLAASRPFAAEAGRQAAGAAEALHRSAAVLPAAERAAYLAVPERARVMTGDHLAFGRPHRRKDPPADQAGVGLGPL